MSNPGTRCGGEELVFFDFAPWQRLAELRTGPITTLTFNYLADSRRFARATHVHLARRWGTRVGVTRAHDDAVALGLPAGLPLARFAPVRRVNRRLQARPLAARLARDGSTPLCWLLDWWQVEIAARLRPGRLPIDCQDDPFQVFAGQPSRLAEIPAHRAATLARAELAAAVHPRLLEGISDHSPRFVVAPNGMAGEFLTVAGRQWPEPAALAGRPRPRLVVVAGERSFEHRVNHELLEAALEKLEGGTLVLVGVPASPGASLGRLARHPRVVALPIQTNLGLVPVLRACDVAAIPHRRPGGGDAAKTYEYLACDLPVVAFANEEPPFLSPWVAQAADAGGFAEACGRFVRAGLAEPGRLSAQLAELTIERGPQRPGTPRGSGVGLEPEAEVGAQQSPDALGDPRRPPHHLHGAGAPELQPAAAQRRQGDPVLDQPALPAGLELDEGRRLPDAGRAAHQGLASRRLPGAAAEHQQLLGGEAGDQRPGLLGAGPRKHPTLPGRQAESRHPGRDDHVFGCSH